MGAEARCVASERESEEGTTMAGDWLAVATLALAVLTILLTLLYFWWPAFRWAVWVLIVFVYVYWAHRLFVGRWPEREGSGGDGE